MTVYIQLLHYELEQAGLPVEGVSSDGRIDYSRELTAPKKIIADAVVAAHDPEGELPWILNAKEAKQKFLDSALADARADLSLWLPLIAAVIAWKVIDQE